MDAINLEILLIFSKNIGLKNIISQKKIKLKK